MENDLIIRIIQKRFMVHFRMASLKRMNGYISLPITSG
jgi:hypothetical protein